MYHNGLASMMIEGKLLEIFHNLDEQTTLKHCLGVIFDGAPLVRSECISNPEQCRSLLKMVERMVERQGTHKTSLRISSLQLNIPENEWHTIQLQHCIFTQLVNEYSLSKTKTLQIAQLCLPTKPLFSSFKQKVSSAFVEKSLEHLLYQFNAEAWSMYCRWLAEEVELARKTFQPDALELYPLRAILDDFCHQVYSFSLEDLQRELSQKILDEESVRMQGDKQRLFDLEKAIVLNRKQLRSLLKIQCELIQQVIYGIEEIENRYSNLKSLKFTATIIYALMAPQLDINGAVQLGWGQQLLLLQLLDEKLHVISAIHDTRGLERTNLVFAIRLALAELDHAVGENEILSLCLHWDENRNGEFGRTLRANVLTNCQTFNMCKEERLGDEGDVDLELLSFLPESLTMHEKGALKKTALYTCDPVTGKISGCTAAGRHLMCRLGL